jgi:hypothetical protein
MREAARRRNLRLPNQTEVSDPDPVVLKSAPAYFHSLGEAEDD